MGVNHAFIECLVYIVQELCQLQDKHATRPDVFDDVEEEQEIEILTQEISQVLDVGNGCVHTRVKVFLCGG